jgi:hypothetical protein
MTTRKLSNGKITRTVTFEVTFAQNGESSSSPFFGNNDHPRDVDFLENIELMHCSSWAVENCRLLIGDGANKNKNSQAAKCPRSLLRKGLEVLLLFVFVIPAIVAFFHGFILEFSRQSMMSLENFPTGSVMTLEQTLARAYPSRQGYAPKLSQRLLPSTSLARVREPHTKLFPDYNQNWETVPSTHSQTFYYDQKKQSHPFVRALVQKGWRQVDSFDEAHLLYSHQQKANWAKTLAPWQRFNYIPNKELWKNPFEFQYHYKEWQTQLQLTQRQYSVYIPETYLLSQRSDDATEHGKQLVLHDIADFQDQIRGTGKEQFWVIKTEDYKTPYVLAGQQQDKQALLHLTYDSMNDIESNDDKMTTATKKSKKFRKFAQRYICDLATWNNQKMEIRVFWAVVSLEPLVVLYHDGYINIVGDKDVYWDHSVNATTNIESRYAQDLRHHPGNYAKQSFSQFEKELDQLFRQPSRYDDENDETVAKPFPAGTATNHVRSQIKDALADMIQIYQQTNAYQFPNRASMISDNSFEIYCADFLLDQSMDVWLASAPKSGCKYDDDYFFMLDLHSSLFLGLVDVLEEVWKKQEKVNSSVMPLEHLGNWQAIYGDGLRFKYDGYDHSHRYEDKPPCPAESDVKDDSSTEL